MKPTPITNWDDFFMAMCDLVARKSKDPSSQCGAVVVGADHAVRSTGFNGFPRGVDETTAARWDRPEKYMFTEHAERNAVYNAARMGTALEGCVMYVNGYPCCDCARAIIQAGIRAVIYAPMSAEAQLRWAESSARSAIMFREAGVEVTAYEREVALD